MLQEASNQSINMFDEFFNSLGGALISSFCNPLAERYSETRSACLMSLKHISGSGATRTLRRSDSKQKGMSGLFL